MPVNLFRWRLFLALMILSATALPAGAVDVVSYEEQIAPLFRKYCAGCHNDAEAEGGFSAESYASLLKGTETGPALLVDDAEGSRIVRLMTGAAEPRMPPEGEPAPSEAELSLLKTWIEQGAKGPAGAEPDRLMLRVPAIPAQNDRRPITALAWSPNGELLAIGRYSEVQILGSPTAQDGDSNSSAAQKDVAVAGWPVLATLTLPPGKVKGVQFTADGQQLVTASGVEGLGGQALLWNWREGTQVREFRGHRDIMFAAKISPDGKLLATCSYDRSVILWDFTTGEKLRELAGHNGAVYDVAFSPDSQYLLSASADATCKVWRVSNGERLDTLGQPLREQYSVTFSPDGKFIAAGGADNRIRIWRFVSTSGPKINPLLHARFAHEGPIVRLSYTPDGSRLVSVAEDRTLKIWETGGYTETKLIENDPEVAMTLAVSPQQTAFLIGRLDGTLGEYRLVVGSESAQQPTGNQAASAATITPRVPAGTEPVRVDEQEPNDRPETAQAITLPAVVKGKIHAAEGGPDVDCFRFRAAAGEEWVFEVNAARSKSGMDSFIEILHADGQPVERLLLQAVRDSYFTFRGKTADQTGDFRLFNWAEMELNEYLYANGEVVKLWLYPRGPDSGFDVYPGSGNRWGYFDTTPLAHALGEPCYIVVPYPPGTELIPNGLPVFRLFYQNDDESQRKLGKDSKLFFTAPADGDYILRLRDVRNMQGDNFHYELTARPRQQDFSVNLADKSVTVPQGGGKEIRFTIDRKDQFEGPVEIHLSELPAGFQVHSPVTIEAGQIAATAVLIATAEAQAQATDALKSVQIEARALIGEQQVSHPVAGFQEIKVVEQPKLQLAIVPAVGGAVPVGVGADGLLEFAIQPGETIMLQVQAERMDFKGEISLGNAEAGRNLPHGVYVDNIGLNGLLMLEDQSQREFFITAAKWVPEQSRLFHLTTGAGGGATTQPVRLIVRSSREAPTTGAE